jgi:hypothetical protein
VAAVATVVWIDRDDRADRAAALETVIACFFLALLFLFVVLLVTAAVAPGRCAATAEDEESDGTGDTCADPA